MNPENDPRQPPEPETAVATLGAGCFWCVEAVLQQMAQESKEALATAGVFADPIVTEVVRASTFYPAEDHHQDYYRQNRDQPYCRYVVLPKLSKLGLKT